MILNFNEHNQFMLSCDEKRSCLPFGFTNVSVAVDGDEEAQLSAVPFSATSIKLDKNYIENEKSSHRISYNAQQKDLEVIEDVKTFDGVDVVEQRNTVINNGVKDRVLTRVATQVLQVCENGKPLKNRLFNKSIIIHYCFNKTQGEGQWRSVVPEDLGLYACSTHPWEKCFYRFDSVSSYSTGAYFPILIIEDKKKNECWYFEILGGNSWFFELYLYGGTTATSLSVKMGGADERLGFKKNLKMGQSYTSCDCIYGVTKGGYEDGIKQLTKYKRLTAHYKGYCPLVFNDYMNCNWAIENNDRILGLIDSAANVGAEVFCIDDGWQIKQGLWYPADENYKGLGVKGIIDYIKSKNMIAGVWFEFETAPIELAEKLGNDIFLKRNGGIVVSRRPLGNFRSQKFLDYLYERVDALYSMGVRYIKNDHNNSEEIGADNFGESDGECLENNGRAFIRFIGNLKSKYPDLILENCGGGAKRSDWGTLRHFAIQSTSDQENYLKNPSIISGSLALMPPEKAGIWCYPYPIDFTARTQNHLSLSEKKKMSDGVQTSFNVVNGFMGAPYLSGRIDDMDEVNLNILKESIKVYKENRDFISSSFPIYPKGTIKMSNNKEFAFGLINDEKSKIILAVWNLSKAERKIEIDLTKYSMHSCSVLLDGVLTGLGGYSFENGRLTVYMKKPLSACLFVLND